MELILGVLGSILVSVLANELYDRGPTLARRVIRKAAKRLPAHIRERYEEEWLAHLDECPGKLSKLYHSLECFLCARTLGKIARNKSNSSADITLDVNTAKFFFALAARQLQNGLTNESSSINQFVSLWTNLSGQSRLPTEDEMKELHKAASSEQLNDLYNLLDSRVIDPNTKSFSLNIKVSEKEQI